MEGCPTVDSPATPRRRLALVLKLRDLAGFSVSGVGPLFSVAAVGGLFAAKAGGWTELSLALVAVPFGVAAVVLRFLNQRFPNAGASYHWVRRILGERASRLQACVLVAAYFLSLPAIAVPAAGYTLALVAPHHQFSNLANLAVGIAWLGLAWLALLAGAKPVAHVTKVFLAIEGLSLGGIVVLALARFSTLHAAAVHGPVHRGGILFPLAGIVATAVMAAPILDGWEVDSYAAEESHKPRRDPGIGGMVGLAVSVLVYAVVFPLLFAEVPGGLLDGSGNPMTEWGARLIPGAPWLALVPVVTSAAGVLLLISYILSRSLFSMGRDRMLPVAFSSTSGRQVPHLAVATGIGGAMAVMVVETTVQSLGTFFAVLLSATGFFLVAEFLLDSVAAAVLLRGEGAHRGLRWCAYLSATLLTALLVGFLVVAPSNIAPGVDIVCGCVSGVAVAFAAWPRSRAGSLVHSFVPETDLVETVEMEKVLVH